MNKFLRNPFISRQMFKWISCSFYPSFLATFLSLHSTLTQKEVLLGLVSFQRIVRSVEYFTKPSHGLRTSGRICLMTVNYFFV